MDGAEGSAAAAIPEFSAMRRLIAAHDWAATPLGPLSAWPPALTSAVGLVLNAQLPMILLWGKHGVCIYNDAYAVFAQGRHPALLGSNVLEGWPEVAALNQRVLDTCLAGRTMSLRDEHVVLDRKGYPEDIWLDLDYSPVPGDDGAPAGVLAVVNETTLRVLSDWRRAEAETQLALAIEATDLGVWERDLVTGVINWTPRCKTLFGLPATHAMQHSDFAAGLHPADRERVLAALARTQDPDKRAVYDEEYRVIGRDDGALRWIAAKGKAVFDETGRPLRINGTMLDITLRKNAELRHACLAELGDRLRTLDSTAAIATAAAEILANCLSAPRAGYAVIEGEFAVVESDWTNGASVSLTGPRLFASLGEPLTRPLREGRTVVINDVETAPETALSHAAFKAIGVTAALNQPLLENGVLCAVLYVHDTRVRHWTEHEIRLLGDIADRTWEASSRARAAQDLRRLNETLEQEVALRTAQRDRMWKLSTDVMLVAGFDGVIASVNPAWKTIFGWSESEIIGRNFIDLTHPLDREAARAELKTLASGQTTKKFETRYRHRDGSYRWLSWRAVPDETQIHAVGRDTTAEREQEGALQAAEEALRQSQKMEAVGQLTGGIAHDFNNLLQGITGALDLIDKRIAAGRFAEVEKFATAARTSAARAVALTHRLLAFSRRQPLDPKPVAANPLAASMEELLRRTMGEAITLTLNLAPDLWLTLCDANQLESAILNLAINARDAMPDGGALTLETSNTTLDAAYAARTPELKPGDYICVSVSDTGGGMEPSVIEQAFNPFFTTKPIGQGTGLGLSMIYGFAKQSEGHARIYSELGRGTTVKLFLPRFSGDEAADDAADLTASPGVPARAAAGETVLVVEDEAVVRNLVLEVLRELGYHALEAADGPAGLEILRTRKRVDLLVTDIGLPGLNGRQLADAGRVLRPGLKVLFMTGYAENAAQAHGFLDPGMEMITKPFPLETLATRLRQMIES